MADLKLFTVSDGFTVEIPSGGFALERQLQELLEKNMSDVIGVRFLASEYATGRLHAGRIDSLGLDENGAPVIVEYKRTSNDNVINQGLFYLDWLLDHRAEFQLLVAEKLGDEIAATIDWRAPRLLCIARDFNRYDEHAVRQIDRNVELIRYRTFGESLLAIELVTSVVAQPRDNPQPQKKTASASRSPSSQTKVSRLLSRADDQLSSLYRQFETFALGLGDDVVKNERDNYFAFRRLKNFACVEIHPSSRNLLIYLKVSPDLVALEEGFSRDVRNLGHFGTGDLELRVADSTRWATLEELTQRAYDAS